MVVNLVRGNFFANAEQQFWFPITIQLKPEVMSSYLEGSIFYPVISVGICRGGEPWQGNN